VWIYRGSASGLGSPAWSLKGPKIGGAGYGAGLASGDIDDDGFSDVLVGADSWRGEGRVFIYLGSDQRPVRLSDFPGHPTEEGGSYFGHAIAAFEHDGIVVGAFLASGKCPERGCDIPVRGELKGREHPGTRAFTDRVLPGAPALDDGLGPTLSCYHAPQS
jgi:FG-GAP repeat